MKRYIGSLVLALGIASCGFFLYKGIAKYCEKDRCVEVRGLSEREVLANRVTWPMSVSVNANEPSALYIELSSKKDTLVSYLKNHGIKEDEIFVKSPYIYDTWDNDENAKKKKSPRYNGSIDVTVISRDVKLVMQLMGEELDLLKQGVKVSTSDYNVNYEYDDLASLKPLMVEEATKNAREVAEKFAEDAECELGSLINAKQGLFTVEEEYSRPQYKQIRVVTNMSYYLK